MSNNLKLVLIHANNIRNIKNIKSNSSYCTNRIEPVTHTTEYNSIKSNEINKLRNPSKGQIYVHINDDDNDEYLFYRFDGKIWLEIK
jgi:hypothetical protein|uniref:Uncharacterized protein n=1 Tax=viral metagenome TaxID=1070528 RepID=A0A6C0IUR0_9ZZZZ